MPEINDCSFCPKDEILCVKYGVNKLLEGLDGMRPIFICKECLTKSLKLINEYSIKKEDLKQNQ